MKTSGVFWVRRLWVLLAAGCMAGTVGAADDASPGLEAGLAKQVRDLALAAAQHPTPGVARVDIHIGRLDPRLRLAPCEQIQPYLPPGTRLWGKTRIGLRCTRGASLWNVYLPIDVQLYGPGLVAAAPLAVGTVVAASDLVQVEVDLAEDSSPAVTNAQLAVGRALVRAINAGQSLRQAHLKPRQWFAAGDTVKVVAAGPGFSVVGEAQAVTAGTEGQAVRIRTEGGRVLNGMPSGDHTVELSM